jgi:hypothetical protein
MSEFNYWQVRFPVILLNVYPGSKELAQELVAPFGLPVRPWVVGSGRVCRGTN